MALFRDRLAASSQTKVLVKLQSRAVQTLMHQTIYQGSTGETTIGLYTKGPSATRKRRGSWRCPVSGGPRSAKRLTLRFTGGNRVPATSDRLRPCHILRQRVLPVVTRWAQTVLAGRKVDFWGLAKGHIMQLLHLQDTYSASFPAAAIGCFGNALLLPTRTSLMQTSCGGFAIADIVVCQRQNFAA